MLAGWSLSQRSTAGERRGKRREANFPRLLWTHLFSRATLLAALSHFCLGPRFPALLSAAAILSSLNHLHPSRRLEHGRQHGGRARWRATQDSQFASMPRVSTDAHLSLTGPARQGKTLESAAMHTPSQPLPPSCHPSILDPLTPSLSVLVPLINLDLAHITVVLLRSYPSHLCTSSSSYTTIASICSDVLIEQMQESEDQVQRQTQRCPKLLALRSKRARLFLDSLS